MRRGARTGHGFTLVELMIVVAILGILAAIAIPTFTLMVNRAKTGEVTSNLNVMFKNAASYYDTARGAQQLGGSVSGYCTVSDSGQIPYPPSKDKQQFSNTDPSFQALGFSIADFVYYSYRLVTGNGGTGKCGNPPGNTDLYTLRANGDLDGDGITSTFEMAVGSDVNNTLYHARGFYVANEME